MHFDLVDRVIDIKPDRIVTIKQVSSAEEYLGDHFAGFPVLPGVMMLECMVQAARRLIETHGRAASRAAGPVPRMVLGAVRALKYGRFVRPGEVLLVEVSLAKAEDAARLIEAAGPVEFRGEGRVARVGDHLMAGAVGASGAGEAGVPGMGAGVGDGTGALPVAVSGRFTLRPMTLE